MKESISPTSLGLIVRWIGLPSTIVWRHPFPGPGLAVRILGRVERALGRGQVAKHVGRDLADDALPGRVRARLERSAAGRKRGRFAGQQGRQGRLKRLGRGRTAGLPRSDIVKVTFGIVRPFLETRLKNSIENQLIEKHLFFYLLAYELVTSLSTNFSNIKVDLQDGLN